MTHTHTHTGAASPRCVQPAALESPPYSFPEPRCAPARQALLCTRTHTHTLPPASHSRAGTRRTAAPRSAFPRSQGRPLLSAPPARAPLPRGFGSPSPVPELEPMGRSGWAGERRLRSSGDWTPLLPLEPPSLSHAKSGTEAGLKGEVWQGTGKVP